MNNPFDKLHPIVKKWVYKQSWKDLRSIQKESIEPILSRKNDVIISASTAAGKTEAAFLPACSAIQDNNEGFGILYISPLKALINDQYRRLEDLCDMLDMKVTPWHGDSLVSVKQQAQRDPNGILLITPESLESLLVRKSGWVKKAFSSLKYIIIDEYHAFIGFERGNHLQSLIHRLESLLDINSSPIPRIALSATLSDMDNVMKFLRPDGSIECKLITGSNSHASLKLQLNGYLNKTPKQTSNVNTQETKDCSSDQKIGKDLFESLRGESNLVFANSRQRTEQFSIMLSDMCKENHVPNEFFPHHGSLSKELRVELESRLQKNNLPTTAVCTMTLELGIDIGKVKSIAQVTAPHSVSSLRQRLGRSGRRNESAILRMYISESELNVNSNLGDKLRLELLQSIAMIRLLLIEKWYEPADTSLYHFSTLLHQILAVIAQWGGVRVDQLWDLLCEKGPFNNITVEHFKLLLIHMGNTELITQLSSGELVLSIQGERLVSHYTFYSVFMTPEEFRVVYDGKTIGTIPVDSLIIEGQHIVFAGRRWKVEAIDSKKRVITVIITKGGNPPKFSGGGMSVHDRVRQEMLNIYSQGDWRIDVNDTKIDFLDANAKELFIEGLKHFRDLNLNKNTILSKGENVIILPWQGDKVINTLTMMLISSGFKASSYSGIIEVSKTHIKEVKNLLIKFKCEKLFTNSKLAELVPNKMTEKYDYLLPGTLLTDGYGAKSFDVNNTLNWLQKNIKI